MWGFPRKILVEIAAQRIATMRYALLGGAGKSASACCQFQILLLECGDAAMLMLTGNLEMWIFKLRLGKLCTGQVVQIHHK